MPVDDVKASEGTNSAAETKAEGTVDTGKTNVMQKESSGSPAPSNLDSGQDKSDQSSVFVDADFHVLYKEYNLRRSKTFLTTVQPPGKSIKTEPEGKELPEKRLRPQEDLGEQEAKKIKISEDITQPESRETEESKTTAEAKLKSQAKTSPAKTGRGRKTSFSQSKRSYRKKVPNGSGAEDRPSRLCALCARRGSSSNLGFLFGPYKPVVNNDDNEMGQEKQEVEDISLWVHEDCAVWAPGVCIVKGKLLGLHEAVTDGKQLVGMGCQNNLAIIVAVAVF